MVDLWRMRVDVETLETPMIEKYVGGTGERQNMFTKKFVLGWSGMMPTAVLSFSLAP